MSFVEQAKKLRNFGSQTLDQVKKKALEQKDQLKAKLDQPEIKTALSILGTVAATAGTAMLASSEKSSTMKKVATGMTTAGMIGGALATYHFGNQLWQRRQNALKETGKPEVQLTDKSKPQPPVAPKSTTEGSTHDQSTLLDRQGVIALLENPSKVLRDARTYQEFAYIWFEINYQGFLAAIRSDRELYEQINTAVTNWQQENNASGKPQIDGKDTSFVLYLGRLPEPIQAKLRQLQRVEPTPPLAPKLTPEQQAEWAEIKRLLTQKHDSFAKARTHLEYACIFLQGRDAQYPHFTERFNTNPQLFLELKKAIQSAAGYSGSNLTSILNYLENGLPQDLVALFK